MDEMSEDESKKLLSEAHVGRLAAVDGSFPYVVPVHYVFVDRRSMVLHTGKSGLKMMYIEHPSVCFEVTSTQRTRAVREVLSPLGRLELSRTGMKRLRS